MSSARLASLWLAATAVTAPSPAPAQEEAGEPRFATVTQVTRSDAYLDAGRAQGLALGAVLRLRRRGAHVATCEVTALADHHAACATAAARPGDQVLLPEPPHPTPPKLPGPRNAPEVLARLREAVLLTEIPKVAYTGPRTSPPPAQEAWAGLTASTWEVTRAGATFVERIDARGRATLPLGNEVAVRLAGERWSDAADRRFRPGDRWQLYVWELRVTQGGAAGDVSLGRFLPGGAPGQPLLDGLQARRRLSPLTSVGVYAGAVPGAVTIEPSLRSPAAGVQFATSHAWGSALEVSGQGRVGIASAPGQPVRAETELLGRLWSRHLDITSSARLDAGGGQGGARLEAARLDVSARPWDALVVMSGFRAFGGGLGLTPGQGPVAATTRRGDLDLRYTTGPWLWLGGQAAAERDISSGLERATFGPTAGTSHLLGGRAGFSASWLEERGWWPGRTVDLAWWFWLAPRWRLSGTLALSRWSREADAQDLELWGSGALAGAITNHLEVRASLFANGAAFAAPAAPYRGGSSNIAGAVTLLVRR